MPPRADHDALFDALLELKRGPSHAAWRVIDQWLKARMPGAKDDDARQATLLAIHRNAAVMDARDAVSAVAWVKRIANRKRIDVARAEHSRRTVPLVGTEGEELPLEASAATALTEGEVPALLLEVEAAVDRVLEMDHPRAVDRIIPRAQARARLLRTMGMGIPEIREALGFSEPLSDAVISKWIERGLTPLRDGIEAWRDEAPALRDELMHALLARIELRRGDAGKPRPTRRKTTSSGEMSVRPRKGRRRPVPRNRASRMKGARAHRARAHRFSRVRST